MTTRPDDGGPAFPRPDWNGSWSGPDTYSGMSLRDWFAGQALIAMAMTDASGRTEGSCAPPGRAESAYEIADAMLAARKHREQAA